ncbi:MAG: hypothetical protein FWE57_01905 [Chitinispirillia bacterium]|nr:hypothetical protein [Chitinispirillia bacterium]
MKKIAIVLGALGALVMFSIYCAEFDPTGKHLNLLDSKNEQRLIDSLGLCKGFDISSTVTIGGRIYHSCQELVNDALAENVPGTANIFNPEHELNQTFNEDRTPTSVTVASSSKEVTIVYGNFARYEALLNWEGVEVRPAIVHPERNVTVVDAANGAPVGDNGKNDGDLGHGVTPEPGRYTITYTASRTLKDGTPFSDSDTRTLIVNPRPIGDTLAPRITVNPTHMELTLDNPPAKFNMMQGVIANINDPNVFVKITGEIPFTVFTTIQPPSTRPVLALPLTPGGDTTIVGTGTFTVTYTAVNPNPPHASVTATRTVTVSPVPVGNLPTPVIALSFYNFRNSHGISEDFRTTDTLIIGRTSFNAFREPGHGATPQLGGVTASYTNNGVVHNISDRVVYDPNNPTSFSEPELPYSITYRVLRAEGEHDAGIVTRTVNVTDNACPAGDRAGPTSAIQAAFPTTIPAGTRWIVPPNNNLWRVVANDDGGMTPYRFIDYGGLNTNSPQPGTYTIKMWAIGFCGTPTPDGILTRTIMVQ